MTCEIEELEKQQREIQQKINELKVTSFFRIYKILGEYNHIVEYCIFYNELQYIIEPCHNSKYNGRSTLKPIYDVGYHLSGMRHYPNGRTMLIFSPNS